MVTASVLVFSCYVIGLHSVFYVVCNLIILNRNTVFQLNRSKLCLSLFHFHIPCHVT